MAILTGKFTYGSAFELQSRVFLKPWVSKIIVRCFSKSGDSSSDFPVRYTPKRSSNFNKHEESTPHPKGCENHERGRFTNLNSSNVEYSDTGKSSRLGFLLDEKAFNDDFKLGTSQSGNLRRNEKNICNSFVKLETEEDGHEWRPEESELMEELDERAAMEGPEEALDELESHNGKYETKHLTFDPSKTKEEAEKMAIRLLAARAFTVFELKKKLLGKKYSDKIAKAVISDFQNRGLINDFFYAETFSRSRWSSSSWGPGRIKQALAKKGVSELDATKAIKVVLEDGEPDDGQVSRLGLSKPSMDHLFAQASKQWLRSRDVPSEKRKSRIITWLQYRGFSWGVINFILKKLHSE